MAQKTLRLILGDQLNINHTWFKQVRADVVYCMFEIRQETDYVKHHIQKIAAFFMAMRSFSKTLTKAGHHVIYYTINDKQNKQNFKDNILQILSAADFSAFEYQYPDEYRLDEYLHSFRKTLSIKTHVADTEHFLSTRAEVKDLFSGKKQILMETFYRAIRKKHNILLEPNNTPVGGKWNFDNENRKKFSYQTDIPINIDFNNNAKQVIKEIKQSGCEYFGEEAENIFWPINKVQAQQMLDYFITRKLPYFGTYQDAMLTDNHFLFHSLLSFALNAKIIHPMEVVNSAIHQYYMQPDKITIAQVEGFVRQIIGWREYMRGLYWWKMPEFATLNYFNNSNTLPDFYWTGNTRMNCMKQCIVGSLQHAYAHHIQRLMITGSFALLAGVNPDAVDAWYLGVYADAIEWVQITNTRGMSQYADGGIVGSKPYVCSANYIDKMSNYCNGCQ